MLTEDDVDAASVADESVEDADAAQADADEAAMRRLLSEALLPGEANPRAT